MSVRVTAVSTMKLGRAHFPEPIEEKIDPPAGVVKNNVVNATGKLSYQEKENIIKLAQEAGFGRGAIVAKPSLHYISADVWQWGIITGLNYGHHNDDNWQGPVTVSWPMKTTTEPRETKHWTSDLFLIRAAPTKEEVTEMTEEMKKQFAVGRRK